MNQMRKLLLFCFLFAGTLTVNGMKKIDSYFELEDVDALIEGLENNQPAIESITQRMQEVFGDNVDVCSFLISQAIHHKNEKLFRLLIEKLPLYKQTINTINQAAETHLTQAIKNNQLAIAAQLLKDGADVDKPSKAGMTPLIRAILTNNPAMVGLILKYNPSLEPVKFVDGLIYDPLVIAANVAAASRPSLLVKQEHLLAKKTIDMKKDSVTILETLLAYNQQKTDEKKTQSRTIKRVNDDSQEDEKQLAATLIGGTRVFDSKNNITTAEPAGQLSIMAAVGKDKVIKELLEHSLFKKAVNGTYLGRAPLTWAVIKGHIRVAELLINAGADLNARDTNGETPLYHAIANNQLELVKFLINKKANITSLNTFKNSLAHVAVSANNPEMLKILLENGMPYTIKNVTGLTALECALSIEQDPSGLRAMREDLTDEQNKANNKQIIKMLRDLQSVTQTTTVTAKETEPAKKKKKKKNKSVKARSVAALVAEQQREKNKQLKKAKEKEEAEQEEIARAAEKQRNFEQALEQRAAAIVQKAVTTSQQELIAEQKTVAERQQRYEQALAHKAHMLVSKAIKKSKKTLARELNAGELNTLVLQPARINPVPTLRFEPTSVDALLQGAMRSYTPEVQNPADLIKPANK